MKDREKPVNTEDNSIHNHQEFLAEQAGYDLQTLEDRDMTSPSHQN